MEIVNIWVRIYIRVLKRFPKMSESGIEHVSYPWDSNPAAGLETPAAALVAAGVSASPPPAPPKAAATATPLSRRARAAAKALAPGRPWRPATRSPNLHANPGYWHAAENMLRSSDDPPVTVHARVISITRNTGPHYGALGHVRGQSVDPPAQWLVQWDGEWQTRPTDDPSIAFLQPEYTTLPTLL